MKNDSIKTFRIERFFILGQPIGAGSYGVVHDAFDPESRQEAAIKILKPEYSDNYDIRDRFKDEALTAAAIDHPSGLPIYGSGASEDGRLFYVMKKVRGRTLEKLHAERGEKTSDQEWILRLLRHVPFFFLITLTIIIGCTVIADTKKKAFAYYGFNCKYHPFRYAG